MASAEVAAAQPISGVSYADAATSDGVPAKHLEKNLSNDTLHDDDATVVDNSRDASENGASYADVATKDGPDPAAHKVLNLVNVSGRKTPPSSEYSGTGQDDAPRSPIKGHRRLRSRASRASLERSSASPARQSNASPARQSTSTGVELEDKVVYENVQNQNGGRLTSVKPSEDYEESLRVDEMERRRDTNGKIRLSSGRVPSAGWESSGIRWAPMNVPLKRRLQTLMVFLHSMCLFILAAYFFFLAAIPLSWPFLFPYIIYILLSEAGTNGKISQRSDWFRRQKIWSLFASYFPARLHRTAELKSTRKYIFGYHPHGIISHGAWMAFATEALGFSQLFPGIKNTLLTLDSNFRIPFYRDYILRMGLASVSKESCTNLLTKGGINGEGMGRAITIVVGGARESLETQPGTIRLVLNCRKGFVKIAVETGADLVPVLAFGENDIYDQINPADHPTLHKMQMVVKKLFGFTTPIFHARGIFNYDVGIMPYRRPMNIVVGRPIEVMQQSTPDFDYVNQIHKKYVEELQTIWETWKDKFAADRIMELEIIE